MLLPLFLLRRKTVNPITTGIAFDAMRLLRLLRLLLRLLHLLRQKCIQHPLSL
jgi:hypothetical protein